MRKLCVRSQRVPNPARQRWRPPEPSLASRPGDRLRRSVDRECVGRAIEPRKQQSGSRRFRNDGRQHRHAAIAKRVGPAGSENGACAQWGSSGTWEALLASALKKTGHGRARQQLVQASPGMHLPPEGERRSGGAGAVPSSEGNRAATRESVRDGQQRSEHPNAPEKQGNPPRGEPVEGRGCREARRPFGRHYGTVGGTDVGDVKPQ